MAPHLIQRVTILGTGLIGGSFALALKKYTTGIFIQGWDRASVVNEAHGRRIIDRASSGSLKDALDGAEWVIEDARWRGGRGDELAKEVAHRRVFENAVV